MADSLITGLTVLTNSQVDDNTRALPLAAAGSGIAGQATIAQIKLVASTQSVKYVTTGSEGSTLTIPVIAGRTIVGIYREGLFIYQVVSAPDPAEYTFDSTNIVLGLAVNPAGGERFQVLYKNS